MAAPTFQIRPNSPDGVHQSAPFWCVAVLPQRYRLSNKYLLADPADPTVTLWANRADADIAQNALGSVRQIGAPVIGSDIDRANRADVGVARDVAVDQLKNNPALSGPLQLLESVVTSWSVSQSKTSPVGQCNLTLAPSAKDYVAHLGSGDWIMVWTFDDKDAYLRVREQIQKGLPANDFGSGLKFVGKISGGPRRARARSEDGTFRTRYTITAKSGTEFEHKIIYNPAMMTKYGQSFLRPLVDFADGWQALFQQNTGRVNSGKAISFFLAALLGEGPSQQFRRGLPDIDASTGGEKVIPQEVAKLLGQPTGSGVNGRFVFADIVRPHIGIQRYSGQLGLHHHDHPGANLKVDFAPFQPQIVAPGRSGDDTVVGELDGTFAIELPDFSQRPLWSILRGFLNEPVNEAYFTLRANAEGRIFPTFVARMVPFASPRATVEGAKTEFLNLPRWDLSPVLVMSDDLGPSNENRANYFHVTAQDSQREGQSSSLTGASYQLVQAPPYLDSADIARNGVQPFVAHLACDVLTTSFQNGQSPLNRWMQFVMDWMSDQHLRWAGTIQSYGIVEPISVGDNLQYDGAVYHIETINHSGSISEEDGRRSFRTSLGVSMGISARSDIASSNVYLSSTDTAEVVPDAPYGLTTADRVPSTANLIE